MTPRSAAVRECPVVHVITNDEVLARAGFLSTATGILREAPSDVALHLRGPRTSARTLERLGAALVRARRDAWLVVNDRIDVAGAIGADGVHLGTRSLDVSVVRRIGEPGWGVGASVHTLDELEARRGADWLIAGTIYPSSSHPQRPPAGIEGLTSIVSAADAPVLAIGGVTIDRVREVRAAGGSGVAVLSSVWEASDPGRTVSEYLRAWRQAA